MRAIYCGKSHGIARFLSSVRRKVMSSSESKMATGVVKEMLLTMGIPMIFSMMLQALYNIVDRDRKSTRLNSSHKTESRMPSSA